MLGNNKKRLSQVIELLRSEPLSCSTAEKISRECSALSEDSADCLFFFVLKHIFSEIAQYLDGQAVAVDKHMELTEETREMTLDLMIATDTNIDVSFSMLKKLAEHHTTRISTVRC